MMTIVLKTKKLFRTRFNSFQKVLTIIGCLFGLGLAIGLVLSGIASIPFTGGLPAWLGILIFMTLATGSFGSAGKYMGLTIDTLIDEKPWNNEKTATVVGCTIGLTLSLIAIPLKYIAVDLIAEAASIPAWEALMVFIPFMTGTFGSACSYIGRAIDTLTCERLVIDLFPSKDRVLKNALARKASSSAPSREHSSSPLLLGGSGRESGRSRSSDEFFASDDADFLIVHEPTAVEKCRMHARLEQNTLAGIRKCLFLNGIHFRGRSAYCDSNVAAIRARTYQFLINNAETDFQRITIIYAMLSSKAGAQLKEAVSESLGFATVAAAREAYASLLVTQLSSYAQSAKIDQSAYKILKEKAVSVNKSDVPFSQRLCSLFNDEANQEFQERIKLTVAQKVQLKEKAYLKELRHKVITPLFVAVNNKQKSNSSEVQAAFAHLKRLAPKP